MVRRILAVFLAHLREALRSPLAWLGAFALVVANPAITLAFGGDDAASRAWLSRALVSEGLRLLLPLAALVGAAYIIRPSPRRGWSILPVRRSEWFAGSALACFAFVAAVGAMMALGGVLASPLAGDVANLERVRYASAMAYFGPREGKPERQFILREDERLEFSFDGEELGETIHGKLQFEIAWTMEQAPERGVPLEIRLKGEREVIASTHAEARRRATFSAPHPGGKRITVVCRAIDPALSVGMKREECRLVQGSENPLASITWLALIGACGALLCAGVTLAVRSLSTAPTAALAGALVLASLTLLPALAPGDAAARARRRDVQGEKDAQPSATQLLAESLSGLPPLNEPANFERVGAGEAAHFDDAKAALLRLLLALALLPAGAALFSRRQIT
jgi:hypothetical protein